MMDELTILWSTLLEYERVLISELADLHKARVREVATADLGAELAPALSQGAVVVIVNGDKHASSALSLGADEVVRSGELTARALDECIQRAKFRAASRRNRDAQRLLTEANERMAFALLAAAIGFELSHPFSATGSEQSARPVFDIAQRFALCGASHVFDAARPIPDRDQRKALSVEYVAPELPEPAVFLSRSTELLELLEQLGGGRGGSDHVLVPEFLRDFAELMSRYLRPWAELEVKAEGGGRASVPRALLTCSLAAVLAGAIEQIRKAARPRGSIQFRCCEREDCVLIEVEHNGEPSASDLRGAPLDAGFGVFGAAHALSCDLAAVREHLRHVGAELLVDRSELITLIRVFLPTHRPAALQIAPSAVVHRRPAVRG
jgi:hypothetical protein